MNEAHEAVCPEICLNKDRQEFMQIQDGFRDGRNRPERGVQHEPGRAAECNAQQRQHAQTLHRCCHTAGMRVRKLTLREGANIVNNSAKIQRQLGEVILKSALG